MTLNDPLLDWKLKTTMLKILQLLPMGLNLIYTLRFLAIVMFPNLISIHLHLYSVILLIGLGILLLIMSKALKYCIWHRLYIYLLLLFLIAISIWFCDIVFIVHGILLLILISLCVYFKKGLC